jgi:predicted Zn-dependent protease
VDHDDVRDDLKAPALLFPDQRDPASAYGVAFDLLSRREPRAALEVLDPALELEPGNTGLRSLRAWAYLMRAQLMKAEEELRGLVEENPDDDWARHALGRALERQSRYADALPHLRLAAAMTGDPEHEAAVLRVERRLAEIGEKSFDELA